MLLSAFTDIECDSCVPALTRQNQHDEMLVLPQQQTLIVWIMIYVITQETLSYEAIVSVCLPAHTHAAVGLSGVALFKFGHHVRLVNIKANLPLVSWGCSEKTHAIVTNEKWSCQ